MDYWRKIEDDVSLTERMTITLSYTTWSLMRKSITVYAEALSLVKPNEEGKATLVRMGLVSQNFNTLKLAADSATKAYYFQSMILLRNVYENWLSFWYLAKFPNQADLWLDLNPKRHPPKAETMRNRIDFASHETKSKLHDFREELNRFTHTGLIAVLPRLRRDQGKLIVRAGIEYHPVEFDACAYSILFWSANMLIAINTWIPKSQNDWHNRYHSTLDEIIEFQDKFASSHKGDET